ncbi:NADPH-dependent 7-cyano-7-deazaguanine reductase QueF [Vibrio gazogenes]|uniref:NADPH-dependent 7-cyano-7-deazaguanine reductase n=1 Tax=Vibrio gazogenes DSM 21264 = NBRC 103151 TaxID=1123492 RepID=A0A1M5BPS5_VIBGA|nr:NADPH-dependent 7-cyano-7-deazaguanine reductase QueF [Vibrio gazogenes]USP13705.1 NADPH-dependent 7-cyano-7-deazaguanine reductase QueF [Vibrio gazogenes]SHF44509.1 7-cyano-7-deazaguanine reductase [Vibrio gazogenes DSM 21264] [Vibrio gazogenes DSM 21264 = NBRC 103151]SJN54392.1 NADPH-dependent 7-cyano-7-deazaguanine reductase [Vibrio gazogenes]
MDTTYSKNLGKKTDYISTYTPQLLDPIPRARGRGNITACDSAAFSGYDLWTGYELSWLNPKGKPMVAVAEFMIPCTSPNLIESKSFKLYLNSLNQTAFVSEQELVETLIQDLSATSGGDVQVKLIPVDETLESRADKSFTCIDDLDIEIDSYGYDEDRLLGATSANTVEEKLCSHLLKSNCLVTNQPDWGSVYIHYQGAEIDRETLLRYIISFREHNEFHEQCVERIFADIKRCCNPEKLTVFARYTRRGGLDINPFRSDFEEAMLVGREYRQ